MWKGSRAAADGQALETGGIATSILHGEGVPLAPWAGYVLAVAIFGAALAARFAMLPVEGGLGFLTFYPAVALAALLFGTGPGLLTMVLGAVTALYIFMPPFWAFKLVFEQMLSVATFSFSGAIICFLTHQMRHHAEELKSTMAALQRRESELARANERLQDLDRAKSEFFSNVSHEFRTPLTLMLGPLENLLAESAGTLSEESRKTLELAHRNALRLLRLVNALLDFSRMEAGRVRPNREATDLAAFTAELASHFSSACTGGGVQLIVDCPPLPQAVGVDRAMWEKIVLNLLSNAFKFTFAGSIEVRLRDLDEQVVLTVRDTGTGIPRHELPHLFERFHRVEGARGRSFEGTGIGLALIHELVRLHGGSVAVDSEQGCGSAFTVRVPFGTECLGETRLGDGAEETARHTSANAIVSEALRWLPEHAATETAPTTVTRGRVVMAGSLMAIAALSLGSGAETASVKRARAMGVAVRFAIGHALLLAIGAGLLIALGWSLPIVVERGGEMLGGTLLVLLGGVGLWGVFAGRVYGHTHRHDHEPASHWHLHIGRPDRHPMDTAHSHLPTIVGAAFAVSSLRALTMLAPFGDRVGAAPLPVLLGLIAVFAIGILLSMSLFGVAFAGVMSAKAITRLGRGAAATMALASIALGVYWIGGA